MTLTGLTRMITARAEGMDGTGKPLNKDNPRIRPIYDGIYMSEAQWFAQRLKLMFVLREPYDSFTAGNQPKGGDWSIVREYFNNASGVARDPYRTVFFVAKAARAIFDPYFTISSFSDYKMSKPDAYRVLQKIAYINLSKMPAYKNSPEPKLRENYSNWKHIVSAQISFFDPDIIVCGGTFNYIQGEAPFYGDFEFNSRYKNGEIDTYIWQGKLVIDAKHPSSGQFSKDEYIQGIRRAYQEFCNKYRPDLRVQ